MFHDIVAYFQIQINARKKKRRGYQEWTIQRHWQHIVHRTQDIKTTNSEHEDTHKAYFQLKD